MKLKELIISLLVIATISLGCGKSKFNASDEVASSSQVKESKEPPKTKDAVRKKSCKKSKKALGIWTDVNSDGSIEGEKFLGYTKNYSGSESAAKNYNYYSASAHPKIGPDPEGFQSNIFFYNDNNGVNFNFFHNIDGAGSDDNQVKWEIKVSGNNLEDRVVLSDDRAELTLKNSKGQTNTYIGDFHYWRNTDGGIIGPLVTDDFTISVTYIENGDLADIAFYSNAGETIRLTSKELGSNSFIIATNLSGEICEDDE